MVPSLPTAFWNKDAATWHLNVVIMGSYMLQSLSAVKAFTSLQLFPSLNF